MVEEIGDLFDSLHYIIPTHKPPRNCLIAQTPASVLVVIPIRDKKDYNIRSLMCSFYSEQPLDQQTAAQDCELVGFPLITNPEHPA